MYRQITCPKYPLAVIQKAEQQTVTNVPARYLASDVCAGRRCRVDTGTGARTAPGGRDCAKFEREKADDRSIRSAIAHTDRRTSSGKHESQRTRHPSVVPGETSTPRTSPHAARHRYHLAPSVASSVSPRARTQGPGPTGQYGCSPAIKLLDYLVIDDLRLRRSLGIIYSYSIERICIFFS